MPAHLQYAIEVSLCLESDKWEVALRDSGWRRFLYWTAIYALSSLVARQKARWQMFHSLDDLK
jgi:hypothetical protein